MTTSGSFYRFCTVGYLHAPCLASHTTFLFPFFHCPFCLLTLALKENLKLNPAFHISLVFKPPLFVIEKQAAEA